MSAVKTVCCNCGTSILAATAATYRVDSATLVSSGSYQVDISNDYGKASSQPLEVQVVQSPKNVTLCVSPESTVVAAGSSVTLTANADGTRPLLFEWRRGEELITESSVPYLVLNNLQREDSGSYQVVVRNSVGNQKACPRF